MKYFFIVFVAALFHQSAWIMMPIYFFVRYKAWSVGTLLLLFFAIAIVGGYEYFSTILFSAIENTQYGHYSQFQEGGASNLRVAVYSVPLIIAFLGRHKLRDIFPASDYMANLTLVGLVFMMISTQNWIFARFSIYFSFYQLILISWIVKLFAAKDQRAVYYGILVCYFFYYYYENVITLEIDYQSTFLGIM
jgi:transmembrane protein EpsG